MLKRTNLSHLNQNTMKSLEKDFRARVTTGNLTAPFLSLGCEYVILSLLMVTRVTTQIHVD